jgi:hypothetical protein
MFYIFYFTQEFFSFHDPILQPFLQILECLNFILKVLQYPLIFLSMLMFCLFKFYIPNQITILKSIQPLKNKLFD